MCIDSKYKQKPITDYFDADYKNFNFHEEITDNCGYIELTDTIDVDCGKHDLAVLHLNIRGLCNKQDELKRLLKSCMPKKRIDVVLLVETWTTGTKSNSQSLHKSTPERKCCVLLKPICSMDLNHWLKKQNWCYQLLE